MLCPSFKAVFFDQVKIKVNHDSFFYFRFCSCFESLLPCEFYSYAVLINQFRDFVRFIVVFSAVVAAVIIAVIVVIVIIVSIALP